MDDSCSDPLTDAEIEAWLADSTTENPDKACTRVLDTDSLARLLAGLRPRLPFAIVERVDQMRFPASDEALDPTHWPTGRAFGPVQEICWEPGPAGFRTLLICNSYPGASWREYLHLAHCESAQRVYYLWGPDNIALGRSPEYRALPAGRGRPQLMVVEYTDSGNGRLLLTRDVEMRREGGV